MKTAANLRKLDFSNANLLSVEEMMQVRGKGYSASVILTGDTTLITRPKL